MYTDDVIFVDPTQSQSGIEAYIDTQENCYAVAMTAFSRQSVCQ